MTRLIKRTAGGSSGSAVRPERSSGGTAEIAQAVNSSLEQLRLLLLDCTDDQYTAAPVAGYSSSVGAHVRHCLDHVAALVVGVERGFVDYDQRERGTDVEFDRTAALDAIQFLCERVSALSEEMIGWSVMLTVMPTADGPCVDVPTSVGREMAFVQSHTIHHQAIIGAMCKHMGVVLPPRFGYAPATLNHIDQAACAH